MNIMALIPARGGSKGIPHKNLTILNGKPLIQYTIEAAQKSEYIDTIFLSSDDSEIISFGKSLGLHVPYIRPAELAADTTSMVDTVLHAVEWIKKTDNVDFPDSIILLQPTSPLRTSNDIDSAISQFISSNTDTLASVHEMVEHPYECIKLTGRNWTFLEKPPVAVCRRQDYTGDYYYINGAIYIANVEFLTKNKSFVIERQTQFYIMPACRGIDVDNYFDLRMCEDYLKYTIGSHCLE